ncbi:MAG TPA: cation-transporting P-type ATPase [Patescibacteria group bacterium]|nr:cation-transporting P-type ATPase [Patescibacteria group bacterium]
MSNYYQNTVEEIYSKLKTNKQGLNSKEALFRIDKFGLNRLKKTQNVPVFFKFLYQFKDLLAIILLVAAGIALIIGEPRDSLIILIIVIVNSLIGFIQEYRAERILAAFKKELPSMAKVIRDGKEKQILTFRLVPGDILVLEAGDLIPADARIFESSDLKTNEFALTGESHHRHKNHAIIKHDETLADINNMAYMGTAVVEGSAKAVVVNTGMETEFGKIAESSQKIKETPTPLQLEMTHTGQVTAIVASAIAISVLVILYVLGRDLKECLLFAIAAGVAVVPEGLPAIVSVALSLGAQRMLKKKALVKKLLHVESLGSVTTICSDKTGTITTSRMTVVNTMPQINDFSKNQKEYFINNLILCNNAILDNKPIGDPVEVAFLEYCQKNNHNFEEIRKSNLRIHEIPFSSKRKKMSVVVKNSKNELIVFTKGSTLELLKLCDLKTKEKEIIMQKHNSMANSGFRMLAIAMKKITKSSIKNVRKIPKNEIENNLTFLGLVALEDPPREGVKEAMEKCNRAGIKVILITGDYELTAKAIALQIGLATSDTKIITGEDLHNMDDLALKNSLKDKIIFARIEPEQKLRIVKTLQEMGEIVAVTGDGVNDVPALVKANIGVAMGRIGTDVTKEAADMILLDDHFATIVNAVEEGRRIFDNTKKFVFYVFSSNSGELLAPLFALILGLPLPLIAIQILAIDLGTDVLPSLALGVEKEEAGIMNRPPRSKNERIINLKMLSRLLQVGLVMGIFGLLIFIVSLHQSGWNFKSGLNLESPIYWQATASTYIVIVFCQIANAFTSRSEKLSIFKTGIFSNQWLIYSEIVSAIMLWFVIGFEPMQKVFKTAVPTPFVWGLAIIAFILFLVIFEARKKSFNKNQISQSSSV